MGTWIDFSRRNDPACPAGVVLFKEMLAKTAKLPDVICFWTKNPGRVAALYGEVVTELRAKGVTFLAQVTMNPYYDLLEPGAPRAGDDVQAVYSLNLLSDLLGGPNHIRLRFDPIIKGFTTLRMFSQHCFIARLARINHTAVNFLVPEYKDVGQALIRLGIPAEGFSNQDKEDVLDKLYQHAQGFGIDLAVCAESSRFATAGILRARCADPDWVRAVGVQASFTTRPSRPGCGCCYSADWGEYRSKGGYVCPHQCVYCYAK